MLTPQKFLAALDNKHFRRLSTNIGTLWLPRPNLSLMTNCSAHFIHRVFGCLKSQVKSRDPPKSNLHVNSRNKTIIFVQIHPFIMSFLAQLVERVTSRLSLCNQLP